VKNTPNKDKTQTIDSNYLAYKAGSVNKVFVDVTETTQLKFKEKLNSA
jgi:hypothetical protein